LATFNPSSALFFLAGGLNGHNMITPAQANAATTAQVATLYSLGARLFEIALLPSLVPAFSDSANNFNPGFTALVPQLQGGLGGNCQRRAYPRCCFESHCGVIGIVENSIPAAWSERHPPF
jgi:hypothetical protein